MLTKTCYNLHIYNDADYIKDNFSLLRLYFAPADIQMLC